MRRKNQRSFFLARQGENLDYNRNGWYCWELYHDHELFFFLFQNLFE